MTARDVIAETKIAARLKIGMAPVDVLAPVGTHNAETILAALDAAGYAVVPTIPTDKMVIAGGEAQSRSVGSWGEPKLVWRNMIDAAKETP